MRKELKSYETALKELRRARDPKGRGRAVTSTLRLRELDGGVISLSYCGCEGDKFVEFWPDNTIKVFFPGWVTSQAYWSVGLCTYGHRKRSAIVHRNIAPGSWWNYTRNAKTHIPAVDGLIFDLATGECLNAPAWPERITHQKAATEWRRKLRTFKRTFKVMAKVGAFNSALDEFDRREPRNLHNRAGRFYDCLTSEDYAGMVKLILDTAGWNVRYQLKVLDGVNRTNLLIEELDNLYARNRDGVRDLAGCYTDGVPRLTEAPETTHGVTAYADMVA